MQFSKIDLAKFPYCLKSSYGRLLSKEPPNPYNTMKKQAWHDYSGRSCLDKVENVSMLCAFLIFSTSNGIIVMLIKKSGLLQTGRSLGYCQPDMNKILH